MTTGPFAEYRDTPLWLAVASTLSELVATREVSVNTAAEYVIGYLCQERAAKKLVAPDGLKKR